MSDLNLGLVGNCTFAALIDRRAEIVWSCLPRFDGDPVFCRLLNDVNGDDAHGYFSITLDGQTSSEQHYLHKSAILVTTLFGEDGTAVRIVDFAPRFPQYGRMYRPTMIIRRIEPLRGSPRIRIRVRPVFDYNRARPEITHGSNHIRYVSSAQALRLTTDVPVSFVIDEVPFVLDEPHSLILGPDETMVRPIHEFAREMYEKTLEYWRDFVRFLALPFEWQEAVIRAAITLKLCSFEESGAIVAAVTTSIPEAANSGRNWDYRYCWLRDAYFVVQALNRLGATRTMEDYIRYLTNIVAAAEDGAGTLQPVYGITLDQRLDESVIPSLSGYRGMGPVRLGNQAFEHDQFDVYGQVVLATTQSFFDQRLLKPGDETLFRRLERVGAHAARLFDKPDAGLWELRTMAKVHTFSSVMCWAACDRLAKIGSHLGLAEPGGDWRRRADHMRTVILERAWDPRRESFVDALDGNGRIDASLLLLADLGFVDARDPRFVKTVAAVERELVRNGQVMRYADADDFGLPENAFTICTFWYIEALVKLDRREEARALFEHVLTCRNPLGLLSEDMDPASHELWGNYPQTYSMVGVVNAAMRLSRSWEEAF